MMIAQRNLEYVAENGTAISVPIQLFSPEEDDRCWACRYTIGWPNGVKSGVAYGFDSVQALILAINSIGNDLYFSDYHKTSRLTWGEINGGYGFPVTKNARDLLVGYDKEFDD
ncbi:DUF6968 family protein [Microvirga puerhi]|uniref:DUF6968 domain-containing protein n=1 Tax=Microvirga puerhi TaxID=2876078 RepID=A0ABS7VVT8_9HYPH|nr:hypothetical protein [Microvirga puerhi]MBZ6079240.1 hypothetical protein [Microvirga puerhi]